MVGTVNGPFIENHPGCAQVHRQHGRNTERKAKAMNIGDLVRGVETEERSGDGSCVAGVVGTAESDGIDAGFFFALAAGASSECGFCDRAKYQEMRSSGMLL